MNPHQQRDLELIADAESGKYKVDALLSKYRLQENELQLILRSHNTSLIPKRQTAHSQKYQITKRYVRQILLPSRKRKQKNHGYINRESRHQRNQEIVATAQSGEYTLEQIAQMNDLTKERIRKILEHNGENIKRIRANYKIKSEEKKPYEQQLVDLLTQHYFTLLIQEEGLNHALAWRCKEKYKCAKSISLEQLEKLIEARRDGKGYYLYIKYAGIATETKTIMQKIPYIKYVLQRALNDIS